MEPQPALALGEIWIIELVLGLLALVLAHYALKLLLKFIHKRDFAVPSLWREKIDHVVRLPLQCILWIIGVTFTLDLLSARFGFLVLVDVLPMIRKAGIVWCLAWTLLRWKTEFFQIYSTRPHHKIADMGMMHVLGRITSICVVIIALMIILQIFGMNIAPLMAFGGIGAAGVAFAAKDVMGNFFGGFMLYITRPFTVGDLILLPDRSIEGYVEEIGWYLTSIRDKEKRPIYLPNAAFSHSFVINSSRMTHRRINEKIGIRNEDIAKITSIVEEIRSYLSSHQKIDANLPVLVFFHQYEEYSLEIMIDVYTSAINWEEFLACKQEVLLAVNEILVKHGAEMPYPTEVTINRA